MMSVCSSLVRLDDLHEIRHVDVASWLSEDINFDYACKYRKEEDINKIIDETVNTWPTQPQEVLRKIICDVFQLKFSAVGEYWKLEKAG